MNIQSRLKKLESRKLSASTEYCKCIYKSLRKLTDQIYNGTKYHPSETTVNLPLKTVCDNCGRFVEVERWSKYLKNLIKIYGKPQ